MKTKRIYQISSAFAAVLMTAAAGTIPAAALSESDAYALQQSAESMLESFHNAEAYASDGEGTVDTDVRFYTDEAYQLTVLCDNALTAIQNGTDFQSLLTSDVRAVLPYENGDFIFRTNNAFLAMTEDSTPKVLPSETKALVEAALLDTAYTITYVDAQQYNVILAYVETADGSYVVPYFDYPDAAAAIKPAVYDDAAFWTAMGQCYTDTPDPATYTRNGQQLYGDVGYVTDETYASLSALEPYQAEPTQASTAARLSAGTVAMLSIGALVVTAGVVGGVLVFSKRRLVTEI